MIYTVSVIVNYLLRIDFIILLYAHITLVLIALVGWLLFFWFVKALTQQNLTILNLCVGMLTLNVNKSGW